MSVAALFDGVARRAADLVGYGNGRSWLVGIESGAGSDRANFWC